MEYEYKSILLTYSSSIEEKHSQLLNEYFAKGWEYVDSISQPISTGTQYEAKGGIIVILKKKKDNLTV